MKVLQEGSLTKSVTCKRCQSELEYEPEDVKMTSYEDGPVTYHIHCPLCAVKLGANSSFVYVERSSKEKKPQKNDDACEGCQRLGHEVTRLRQLLRDLVDFDMGDMPRELDALCAVEGPRKLARMERAWRAARAEVGPRNMRRFEGDEP